MKLRTRLALTIMLTSTISLVVVVAAFVINDYQSLRNGLRDDLTAQANSISSNVREALARADQVSAEKTLASASAYPFIAQAGVYLVDGTLLARYRLPGAHIYAAPTGPGFFESRDSLILFHPVEFDGKTLGHVLLRGEMKLLDQEMNKMLLTAGVILLFGGLVSFAIAMLFQRQITVPITSLTRTMAQVTKEKNYDVMVPTTREDELGQLVKMFNNMIGEIRHRDATMAETVAEQTAAITRDNKFISEVLQAVPAIIIVLSPENGSVRTVNRKYYDYTGAEKMPASLNGVATHLRLKKAFVDRLRTGEEIHGELLPCDLEDRTCIFEVTYFPIADIGEYLLELEDITTRIAFQNELMTAKRRIETTLGALTDAVLSTDMNGRITYLNPVAESMLGVSLEDVRDRPSREVIRTFDANTGVALDDPVEFYIRNRRAHPIVTRRQRTRDDPQDSRVVECVVSVLEDNAGNREGVVLVLRDVTEVRDLINKISHQATHDALTGLLNRDEFQRRLRFATTTAVSDDTRHTLMYLDLDKFKVVNDTCGHAAGDMLLAQLTNLMKEAVRTGDTVARLGGDEFGILMLDCPQKKAQQVAETIRNSVHEFRFSWEKEVFQVGVSIGLVMITPDTAKHESVLSLADSACYAAKEGGRNRIYVYDAEDREFADRFGQVLWANKIARALDTNGFFIEAQRISPLTTVKSELDHYEILVRMRDEDGKTVPPGLFLGAAENYGLMHDLDAWVVGTVLDWCRSNPEALSSIGKLAINLSGHSITNIDFHERIRRDIVESRIPGERLCFEFTETAAISNFEAARRFIDVIGDLGCTFSIDDFGTGMSSFAYLKNFPVHYLKIDGVFIRNIVESRIDEAMVRSINDVGHALEMHTIAEFVENDEIVEVLRRIGVDFAQGYGIHKPSSLDTLIPISDSSKISNA